MEEDPESSVRVAVRVRPLIGREKVDHCDECVSVLEDQAQVIMGKDRSFGYDYVFGKYSQQRSLWRCVEPLVDANFSGYNATVFAYGQTGSGKTYTMGSGSNVNIVEEEQGILPRVIEYMFNLGNQKMNENDGYEASFRVQFMEIYGEDVIDLLEPFGTTNKVSIRESETGAVQVVGATKESVDSADKCMRLLEKGTLRRTTGSTLMNAHSSRSHAVFTLLMTQKIPIVTAPQDADTESSSSPNTAEPEFETRESYLHIVDLAGSERQKKTKSEGKRLKEGIDINKGLLALGNVISALGDVKKRGKVHVPYRDSKLTRMLQDSLGGNSRTLMITCVSPADYNFEETLNALKYAHRARNIQNKAVVNRDSASAAVEQMRQQVLMLQAEVLRLRGGDSSDPGAMDELMKQLAPPTAMSSRMIIQNNSDLHVFRERSEAAEEQVLRLMEEVKRHKTSLDMVTESMISAQAERDFFRLSLEEAGIEVSKPDDLTEEDVKKQGVLKEHLARIASLEEKLREAEKTSQQSARSIIEPMNIMGFSSSSSNTKSGNDDNLISMAKLEIQKDAEKLEKLSSAVEPKDTDPLAAETSAEEDGTDEAAEAEMQRIFQQRQQHLGASLNDLSNNIKLKEQLVLSLQKSQQNYERMKEYYQQKMDQMTEEVKQAQNDRETLLSEIKQTETKSDSEESKRQSLVKKLKDKDSQLADLKKKQREMQRFMQLKSRADQQVRQLYSEISNMKRQKIDLVKKMQHERKQNSIEAASRMREIQGLKRASQKDKQKLAKLGSEKDLKDRVMRRKLEDVTAANRRLRLNQTGRHLSTEEKKKKAWLSAQIKKLAIKQEKAEKLEKELSKREKIVSNMESLHGMRNKLQEEFEETSQEKSATNIRDVLISPSKDALKSKRRKLSAVEEQTLFELEERIESCQAQLEYKDDKISKMSEEVHSGTEAGEDQTEASLEKQIESSSLPEARTLLKVLFEMAVARKKSNFQKKTQLSEAQGEIEELKAEVDRSKYQLQHLKLHSDSELIKLQKEQEEKLSFYMEEYKSIRNANDSKSGSLVRTNSSSDAKTPAKHSSSNTDLLLSIANDKNDSLVKRVKILERNYNDLRRSHAELKKKERRNEEILRKNASNIVKRQQTKLVVPTNTKHVDVNAAKSTPTTHRSPLEDNVAECAEVAPRVVVESSSTTSHDSIIDEDSEEEHDSKDIFSRLANPTNFTGIHKNRMTKSEIKEKSEKLRAKRAKDKRIPATTSSAISTTASTERPSTAPQVNAATTRKQRIEETRKHIDSVHSFLGKLDITKSQALSTEAPESNQHEKEISDESIVSNQDASNPEKEDVYTRLAAHYTKCSQPKRQKAIRNSLEKKPGRSSLESFGSVSSMSSSRQNSGTIDDLSDSEDVCNYNSQDELDYYKKPVKEKSSAAEDNNQCSETS